MSPARHNQLQHLVSGRVVLDRVLCCQTDAAEQDEEEDEVGEDVMVDDLVARDPEPIKQRKKKGNESDVKTREARERSNIHPLVGVAEDEEGASLRHGNHLLLQLNVRERSWPGAHGHLGLILILIP